MNRGDVRTIDTALDTIGLPTHPQPAELAQQTRRLADTLAHHGRHAITSATLLASRGYPTSTLGTNITNGHTASSSTERSALAHHPDNGPDPTEPHQWADINARLAGLLALHWRTQDRLETLISELVAHGDDTDPIPAGTGECERCGRFVRPSANRPDHRLRAGLCETCRKAWRRAQTAAPGILRAEWLRQGRAALKAGTERHGRLSEHQRTDLLASTEPPTLHPTEPQTCRTGHTCCTRTSIHTHWHPPDHCPDCNHT